MIHLKVINQHRKGLNILEVEVQKSAVSADYNYNYYVDYVHALVGYQGNHKGIDLWTLKHSFSFPTDEWKIGVAVAFVLLIIAIVCIIMYQFCW